ncbi:RDD family protein [Pararhizobium sp. IMCC21322]|uniref:RDD family protein n=1 Tax=Pararhizobium sp. IMCC21322 TaxID=3067903 RepID=UPI002741930A|nr:RDD family protein [Pararhizobium sp. IMCC21322]
MANRYFIRRAFAHLIDFILVSIVFAFITVALNSVFDVQFIAPGFYKSTACVPQQIVSAERMQELLPTSAGQVLHQSICRTTNMGLTTHNTVVLRRSGIADNGNTTTTIEYLVDESGKQTVAYSMEPFLVLLAPLIFAGLITMRGKTFGKQALGLVIFDSHLEKPKLLAALKREYLKALFFVLGGLIGIYGMFQNSNENLDQLAADLDSLAASIGGAGFWLIMGVGLAVLLGLFWYTFGSFIRWRGRTYWDKWSNLDVGTNNDLLDLISARDRNG